MSSVLAAGDWKNNAEMIADVAKLYLPDPNTTVVDVTYGLGKFWSIYRPVKLVAHDLDPAKGDGVDFRRLPEATASVSTVVFDPAYVAPGGRKTSTIGDMNDRYGMHTTASTPAGQWEVIENGIAEAHRILEVDGLLWFKCMNYIWSGKYQHCMSWAYKALEPPSWEIEAEFVLKGGTGPQPTKNRDGSDRRQAHPRNNYSTLVIARKLKPATNQEGLW